MSKTFSILLTMEKNFRNEKNLVKAIKKNKKSLSGQKTLQVCQITLLIRETRAFYSVMRKFLLKLCVENKKIMSFLQR